MNKKGFTVRMQPEDYQAAKLLVEERGNRTTIGDIIHEWKIKSDSI